MRRVTYAVASNASASERYISTTVLGNTRLALIETRWIALMSCAACVFNGISHGRITGTYQAFWSTVHCTLCARYYSLDITAIVRP